MITLRHVYDAVQHRAETTSARILCFRTAEPTKHFNTNQRIGYNAKLINRVQIWSNI